MSRIKSFIAVQTVSWLYPNVEAHKRRKTGTFMLRPSSFIGTSRALLVTEENRRHAKRKCSNISGSPHCIHKGDAAKPAFCVYRAGIRQCNLVSVTST